MDTFDRAQMARRFAEILTAGVDPDLFVDLPMDSYKKLASACFDLADAMLAEENKRKNEQCQK